MTGADLPATVRAFIAVPLSDRLRDRLGQLGDELQSRLIAASGKARFVRPAGIHLTLKFLGDVPAMRVSELADALSAVAVGVPAFRLEVGGVGSFGSPRRPRVLWVGVAEPSGVLQGLAASVDRACADLGFDPERRPFRAHLTLARFKAPPRGGVEPLLEPFRERVLGPETVSEVVLYRSELTPSGARYSTLARAGLSDR